MKLYGFAPSPNTWKVRAVAAHLGVPLEYHHIDLTKGESHTPTYLAINPTGRTPTLVDSDLKLWESNAIMQYLASQKANSLWPDNARARADISRWQCWQLAHWDNGCVGLIFNRLVKKLLNLGPPDEAAVAKALECFNRDMAILDVHFGQQPYLTGKDVTLADFAVASPLFHAQAAEMPMGPYKKVQEWFGRVSALPCWSQTAPQLAAAA